MMKKIVIILMMWTVQSIFAQGFFNGNEGSATMQDVLKSDCCWLGQYKIMGNIGAFYSKITYLSPTEKEINYDRYGLNFNLNTKFYKEFQLRLSLYADMNQDENKPKWLSNLYYSLGNYNWRDRTFSYGYENYQPNRFDGTYNWLDNLKRGFFFVSYNYYAFKDDSSLKLDGTTQLFLTPFVRYQPEYTDRYGEKVLGNNKLTFGMASRYVIWHNFYVEGSIYLYPNAESKLPWDPDFTYGFGYFDWRSFKVNFSYGNWIANRFPWNDKEMKNDFSNGEFKLMFSFIW
jgi:hypothetical protein